MTGVLEERPGCRNYYLAGIISRFSAVSVHTLAATLDTFVRNDYEKIYTEPHTGFSSKDNTTPPLYIPNSLPTYDPPLQYGY